MEKTFSTIQDEEFIRNTYKIAKASIQMGFEPFAALLVKDGKVKYSTHDRSIEYSDPTGHAELIAISEYCRDNKLINLKGYTLYSNVEPCIMCSGAIHWAKISVVVFGVYQKSLQTISKGKVKPSCEMLINSGNTKVEIVGGILEDEGLELLSSFPFKSKEERIKVFDKKSQGK